MHFSSVIHILGYLQIFLAIAMLLPIMCSLYFKDHCHMALLISAAITGLIGLAMVRLASFKQDLRPKEGFAVVSLSWVLLSFFGALPFMIHGCIPSLTDAYFETMSGLTTTGATILTDIESLPKGLLMWRSLTQWIGGMGIIVLTLAILPFLGVGGMQLFKAEVPGPSADKLTPRVAQTAKILWGVYLVLTVIQVIVLEFAGMSWFDAVCHSFATMATGGYSTRNASIAAFNSPLIEYITIFFMFLAGTNFALHYRFVRGDMKAHFLNREFLVYVVIMLFATLFICGHLVVTVEEPFSQAFRDTLFQVVSIMTTTGYGTADYETWTGHAQVILFFLMFVGGCAGSTAGGMKVSRVYLLVKFAFYEFVRLLHPRAVISVKLGDQIVSREIIFNLLGYFVLFMTVFGIGVFALSGLGMDFMSAFGASVSCVANVGPGLGTVGPTDNYADVHMFGKWILSFLMLLGRLEFFTVLILFAPSFWRK